MKVLVTGGYGFIGSFVAERFFKEGYQVYIIDNLVSGNAENIDFPHKFYKINVESKKCEEVFKSNKFDVVVHLAAQVDVTTSMKSPVLDTRSNILGLSNILDLSTKYAVGKFIFASSAAVYGMNENTPLVEEESCEPLSPYGMNKWIGEMYCRKWNELYDLQTLCFRFSNVYGPRQGTVGEGGVVSIFIERMLDNQGITVYGDGHQTRDFIYVEDLADAVYRSVESDASGVMNLSSNTENSVNRLIEVLQTIQPIKSVQYREAKQGDIFRSSLDNSKIKRQLDWIPMYTLEEGLEKTYRWFADHKVKEVPKPKKPENFLLAYFKKLLPYLENALAFIVVIFLTVYVHNGKLYDLDDFDFSFFYIILMGIMYGSRQSIPAVFLSSIFYVSFGLMQGRDLISLLYDSESLAQIAVYVFVGIAIGYTVDRKNRAVNSYASQVQAIEERYEFLNEIFNDTRKVKEELQSQIINSSDSFGKIYTITKELDTLEPENIYSSAVGVLESIMKSDAISIYSVNKHGSFLRLSAKSKKDNFELPKSLRIADQPRIGQVIESKEVFINHELESNVAMLMAPIVDNGQVVALVSVHDMQYENFSLYHQNLFKVAIELITAALSKAYRFWSATMNERYVEGMTVLKEEAFGKVLETKRATKERLHIEYGLLMLDVNFIHQEEKLNLIQRSLRESDYLGLGKSGQLLALLANSSKGDTEIVRKRLAEQGVDSIICEEEVMYG
ncbi:NAD-dependent epimerase/dehydratase family protein [Paenibacillus rigui]|uniref:Nucleoside-diphosphate sugar epimerase n=1 Tax=Paenibacillus rigui TaxID=554312 RepID=A0A229UTK4_9BACL|nr:NAD-dependent epimerase/dehydratase family protein [Paenibacillus rigui]OXM86663.1 nucleoside-diphosphate sugar epimerase [Paenibacillus rigui]